MQMTVCLCFFHKNPEFIFQKLGMELTSTGIYHFSDKKKDAIVPLVTPLLCMNLELDV
jgi:hypothetical protein